jgi:3-methyladenine DNA glycosylase AlkD
MQTIHSAQATQLGKTLAEYLRRGETARAYETLAPLLKQRIAFAMLDRIGRELGQVSLVEMDEFLERLARSETIGSWAILGSALAQHLDDGLRGALERERTLSMIGDVWYAADAIGERVAGPALVKHFEETLEHFDAWRVDENPWVRRSIGVGVHVWAKRQRGAEIAKATRLLKFLEPLFGEQEMDAVKGIGWGLKTLGRYYPDLMKEWLAKQKKHPHRALMLKKATTYLGGGGR